MVKNAEGVSGNRFARRRQTGVNSFREQLRGLSNIIPLICAVRPISLSPYACVGTQRRRAFRAGYRFNAGSPKSLRP